jgi:general secretion pathway protein A
LLGNREPDGEILPSPQHAASATTANPTSVRPETAPEKSAAATPPSAVSSWAAERSRFEDLLKSRGASHAQAFARLFGLWKINGDPNKPCESAERQGLHCLGESSGWEGLRRLNHPAVLEFVLPGGEKRYGTLTGIADGRAIINIDGEAQALPLSENLPLWEGRFMLLWRPPVVDITVVKPGQSSPAVGWLRQRLPSPQKPADPQRFDDALKAQVAAFQQEHGLIVDGAVGPHTFICLINEMKRPDIPRLN